MSNEKIKVDNDTNVLPWNNGIDYTLLKDINDKKQIYHNDVSDPDYLENTFNFYKSILYVLFITAKHNIRSNLY